MKRIRTPSEKSVLIAQLIVIAWLPVCFFWDWLVLLHWHLPEMLAMMVVFVPAVPFMLSMHMPGEIAYRRERAATNASYAAEQRVREAGGPYR